MANRGPNINGSQFFITLAPSKHLDKKHVAFGKVVKEISKIRKMEIVETENEMPVPMQRIVVMDCGIGSGKHLLQTSDHRERRRELSSSSLRDERS
jgi:peptidyl-prolyl isomerase D